MRHVMVKIELDSRLGLEEVDTMMGRVESGRVCVVCTRYVRQLGLYLCRDFVWMSHRVSG